MKENIYSLLRLLTKKQKKETLFVQLLMLFASFFELLSIFTVGYVIRVISNTDENVRSTVFQDFFGIKIIGLQPPISLVLISILIFLLSTLISTICTWRIAHFSQYLGIEISSKLYRSVIEKPWDFFIQNDTAGLINKLVVESERLTQSVIYPLLVINSKIILMLFLLMGLLFTNIIFTVMSFIMVASAYLLIFLMVRNASLRYGIITSQMSEKRLKLMTESFQGIREIKVSRSENRFIKSYDQSSDKYAKSKSMILIYSQLPKYTLEFFIFSTLVCVLGYFSGSLDGDQSLLIEQIIVFGMVGLKILPAINQTYGSIVNIKGNLNALSVIEKHFDDNELLKKNEINDNSFVGTKTFSRIELKDLYYVYPGNKTPALKRISFSIEKNKVIGMTGVSGSGKSTIADLLLGLIKPSRGELIVESTLDGHDRINIKDLRVSYVSQNICLFDETILRNIAFGESDDQIDMGRVQAAIETVNLTDFMSGLKNGLNTVIGENGVRMSGGQRQRLAIARALYSKPCFLILDEATSALDNLTEQNVLENIFSDTSEITIVIIAHRLSTLYKCDEILVIRDGSISDKGSYTELSKRNKLFIAK